jgi:hypothetical protein
MLLEIEERMDFNQYMDILEEGVEANFKKLEIEERKRIF